MSIATALNYKPVTSMGVVLALHTAFYAVGIASGADGFAKLVIYPEVVAFMSPIIFGAIMMVSALIALWGYSRQSDTFVKLGSRTQCFIWLFVTSLYFLGGDVLIAATNGLIWAVLTFITGYCFVHRDSWWSGSGTPLDLRTKNS